MFSIENLILNTPIPTITIKGTRIKLMLTMRPLNALLDFSIRAFSCENIEMGFIEFSYGKRIVYLPPHFNIGRLHVNGSYQKAMGLGTLLLRSCLVMSSGHQVKITSIDPPAFKFYEKFSQREPQAGMQVLNCIPAHLKQHRTPEMAEAIFLPKYVEPSIFIQRTRDLSDCTIS